MIISCPSTVKVTPKSYDDIFFTHVSLLDRHRSAAILRPAWIQL